MKIQAAAGVVAVIVARTVIEASEKVASVLSVSGALVGVDFGPAPTHTSIEETLGKLNVAVDEAFEFADHAVLSLRQTLDSIGVTAKQQVGAVAAEQETIQPEEEISHPTSNIDASSDDLSATNADEQTQEIDDEPEQPAIGKRKRK